MRVAALIGAALALAAVVLLTVALTETREILGHKSLGVPTVSRWGNKHFTPPWLFALYLGIVAVVFGYVIGDRYHRPRDLALIALGAAPAAFIAWLLSGNLSEQHGRHGDNNRLSLAFVMALVGGAIAAELASRIKPKRRRRFD